MRLKGRSTEAAGGAACRARSGAEGRPDDDPHPATRASLPAH